MYLGTNPNTISRATKGVANKLPIVMTYKIRVFFEGAQKEVFSSILKNTL